MQESENIHEDKERAAASVTHELGVTGDTEINQTNLTLGSIEKTDEATSNVGIENSSGGGDDKTNVSDINIDQQTVDIEDAT